MNWNVFALRTHRAAVAGLALNIALATGSLRADDKFGSPLDATATKRDTTTDSTGSSASQSKNSAADTASPATKAPKKTTRDPVAAAMTLPRGKVLSKKQQEAFDKLKATQGEDLRKALDDMAQAKTATDKNKALKAIKEARLAIRTGMASILATPTDSNGQTSGSDSSGSYSSSAASNGTGNYGNANYANGGYNNGYGGNYVPYGNYPPGRGPTGSGTAMTSGGGSGGNCPPVSGGRSHR